MYNLQIKEKEQKLVMSSQTVALIVVYQTMFWKSKLKCEALCNNVYEWSILFDFFLVPYCMY